MRTRADSPTKTCTKLGCLSPLRARGLCSTHYNQERQPQRHARRTVACSVCGATIERRVHNDRRPTCSPLCRTLLQHGGYSGVSSYDWARDAAQRARQAGALVVEMFNRHDVFVRDGWTCRICGAPVDVTVSAFHPDSPTVDHIVPLSRGGSHTLDNVQCACLRCNSIKSDSLLPAPGGSPRNGHTGIPPGRVLAVQTPEMPDGR